MIYSVNGTLIHKTMAYAVVECGGVGMKAFATLNTLQALPQIGAQARLFTYLNVREDALELYGFATEEECSCFKLLTSVSGVGAKAGLAILSTATPSQLHLYIATGDVKSITKAQGVGAKLAQRIVLELKDKVTAGTPVVDMGFGTSAAMDMPQTPAGEAVSALVALGYSQTEASVAVAKQDQALSTEGLIKGALKAMMRG